MKSSTKKARPVEINREKMAPPAWQPAWWHWLLGSLAVFFAAFEVYGPALRGEFLFDDSYLPFLMANVADAPLRSWLGVRPLLMTTYWVNYQTSGLDPYPYHSVGVFLHALNAMLAGCIVRRFLGWAGETGWRREALALFAGGLFLLHPVQTESVAYVSSRSETLSVFFFLSAFAVFLYRRTEAIGFARSAAVVALFLAAVSTKEHAAVLPALLLMTDYYFQTPFRFSGIKRNMRLYGPLAAAAIVGVAGVIAVLRSAQTAGFQIKEFTWYEYLFTQFRVIWMYLRLYVAPYGLNADYEFSISRTILDGGSLIGLLGLLALAVVAWRYWREYPLASYGYFGFLILLAPTSSFVPIRDVAVERRLYLPFICLLLITVDLLRRWQASRTVLATALTAVCAVAGMATYQRSQVWSDALALWRDTNEKSPGNSRALFQLAYAQWHNGQCGEAAANYERVSRMQAPDDRLLIDWALALECADRPDEAAAKVRQAMQSQPSAHGYSVLGMIFGKRGRADEALEALATAEQMDPNFEMTYVYRGNIYASQGNKAVAAGQYQRALEINPRNEVARQGLALARSPR